MPIKADCSSCGHTLQVSSKYAGKKVKCPACKESISIPAAKSSGDAPKKAANKAGKITVKCECGTKFGAKPELAGKKVKCPGCGNPVKIPAATKASVPAKTAKAKPPAVPKKSGAEPSVGGLFDEVGFNTEDGSAHKKCPECRAAMADEAIICIDCGYNETTGKRMETYRPVTAEDRAKRAEKPDPGTKPKKKGWFSRKSK